MTDLEGCKDTVEVEIREPDELIATADSLEISCFGLCDGKAWVQYSGGTAPHNLNWYTIGGMPTTDTVENLCPGPNAVIIEDFNECKDTAYVTITTPTELTSFISDTTHLPCFSDCSGEAIVNSSGGVYPYSYSWLDKSELDVDSVGENLCVGLNRVEIRDFRGCLDTSEVVITSNSPEMTSTTDSILTSCVGSSDGIAIVIGSGGVGPYLYDWYNDGNNPNDTLYNVSAGTYYVEVEDDLGCLDTVFAVVTDPDTLRAIISDTTYVLCFGDSTGSATVTPIGGTPKYSYNWYDAPGGITDSIATGLPSGTYHVEVTDANGCKDTGIVIITEPSEMLLGSDSIPATCTGICTGSAIVVPSGGVGPYNYAWYTIGGMPTTDTASGLCADFYSVEVTDFNGCVDTLEVEVTEPSVLSAVEVDSMATTCNGGSDGWAAVEGTGGTEPYDYWWSDELNQTSDTATGLKAGLYKAAVTDFRGCSDTVDITITQPDTISPNDSIVHVSCAGLCNGVITLNVSGGTKGAGYTHSWSVASADTFITNLCANTYTDTITDGAGCKIRLVLLSLNQTFWNQ